MAASKEVTLDDVFNKLDKNADGQMSAQELKEGLLEVGFDSQELDEILAQADADNSGAISRAEFVIAMKKVNRAQGKVGALGRLVSAQSEIMQYKTKGGGVHTYSQEELSAFADHMNHTLADDPDLKHILPLDVTNDDLFSKMNDGWLLAKFVNKIRKDTIDIRALNKRKKGKKLHKVKLIENLNVVVFACKSVGVQVHNIGSTDLFEVKNPALALGLVWQMVKMQLLSDINLQHHPELLRLLREGETMQDLLALSPEEILKRWMNYHLAEAGSDKRISNFGKDVKDSEAYLTVLHQIGGDKCPKDALSNSNKKKRAEVVLQNARNLGCKPFIKADDIKSGNQKLNLAFVADLFNTCPGLEMTQEEIDKWGLNLDDDGDSREERVFRLWANCLGIPNFYLNYLFKDLHDGIQFLKIIDAVEPGTVNWNKNVEKKPKMIFHKNSNNSLAVSLLKGMRLNIESIGGQNITKYQDTLNHKLVLGCLWQLFRFHSVKFLSSLGKEVTDDEILRRANAMVESVGGSPIKSFKDVAQSDGRWCCNLVKAYKPDVFDDELVEEDPVMNARYAISIAMKHQMQIFVLPEDLVEPNKKMVMTFAAAVLERQFKAEQN